MGSWYNILHFFFTACTTIQEKVTEFSKAAHTLCGLPLDSHITKSCSCPYTWTSITMTTIGYSNFQSSALPATSSYEIPDTVPDDAKEVLVYAYVHSANSNPATLSHFKIYTEEDDNKYEQYITLRSYYGTSFINTNTDNLWFPMPSNRRVFMEIPSGGRHGGARGDIYVIGYR